MLISDPILEKLFITASLSSGDILPCINPTLPGNSTDNCSYLHWEKKVSKKKRKKRRWRREGGGRERERATQIKKERKADSDRVSESERNG